MSSEHVIVMKWHIRFHFELRVYIASYQRWRTIHYRQARPRSCPLTIHDGASIAMDRLSADAR
jgi:hypothetical protein